MKKMFRALLLCLALVLCLMPVLASCDSAEPDTETDTTADTAADTVADTTENAGGGNDVTALEGRQIAKFTSMDKTRYVKMYQVEETAGKTEVKCSLILYNADGTVVDSVSFQLKVNAEDVKFECFHKTTWHDDKVDVIVRDHDGAEKTYTLNYAG